MVARTDLAVEMEDLVYDRAASLDSTVGDGIYESVLAMDRKALVPNETTLTR